MKGVRLARNFGHQAALGAGLEHTSGDAVVVLDADLQDPPDLVPQMLEKWRQGYDVVYAQRNRRQGESIFKRVAGYAFYRVLERLNDVDIPRDTGDFALMDARVVQRLRKFKEHALFWRGLHCWSGFKQTAVHFDRPPRTRGETKYTLRKLIHLASAGLLSYSSLPLRLGLYAGSLLLAGCALSVVGCGVYYFCAPGGGWPISPVALTVLFVGGVQLLCLGVMGEYLNRIYDETRDRPRWLTDETIGLGAASAWEDRRRQAG